MKTISRFVYTILFLFITCLLPAQNVTINRAMNIAKNHLSIVGGDKLKSANINRVRPQLFSILSTDSKADTLLFILNDTVNNNFVIVSADERVWPIIGYSLESEYSENNQPPAFTEWMENRKREIEYVKQNDIQPESKISQQWDNLSSANVLSAESTSSVEPLLKTQWNQGCYYNSMCPSDVNGYCGGHVPTGCSPTAMAQIMKYWEFPTTGIGSHTYTHPTYGTLSADFGSTTYQWAQMPNNVTSQNDAVATLMYHCGVSLDTYYRPNSSGAGVPRNALINYFNYSSDALWVERKNYSTINWTNLIKLELDSQRPIYYNGSNLTDAHAFVCDGYQNSDYFHFNWGWGGNSDGYFYLGDMLFPYYLGALIKIFPTTLPDGFQGFFLSTKNLEIVSNGGSETINISSSANWTATSNQTWLSVNSGTGLAGDSKITLIATENNTTSSRSATVTISSVGFDDQLITVSQGTNFVITPGNLHNVLASNLSSITNLTIKGEIDARDFRTMRDEMPLLEVLDLSDAQIVEYIGTDGTGLIMTSSQTYLANVLPFDAFFNNNTFVAKTSLTKIILPKSITSIGFYAFSGCSGLKSISIPNSVTTIDQSSFHNCNGMTSIYIPSSVNTIANDAFSYNSGIITVALDNPNYSSNEGVLFDKNQYKLIHCPTSKSGTYNIPSTIKSIEAGAFQVCNNLTSIFIPTSVTTIGEAAFYDCHDLSSVTIPSSVITIGCEAFSRCGGLNSLYAYPIPPVNLSASQDAFKYINMTTCKLYVPFGSSGLYSEADQWKDFTNREEMQGLFVSPGLAMMSADEDTALVKISCSSNWTLSSDQEWLKVNIVSGGSGIFDISLTATAFGNTDNRIAIVTATTAGYASQTITVEQYGKTNVTAGNLSTILGTNRETTSYLVLSGTLDARDFKTMRDEMPLLSKIDLTNVTIVEYTGTGGTYNSNSITYPANTIPKYAFYNPTTNTPKNILQSVVFPLTAISIGSNAFYRCSGLPSIKITDSILSIGSYAFSSCTGLTKITIPASVTSIESGAFSYCWAIIAVDDNNKNYSSLEGVLFNKTKTHLIQCPVSKKGSYVVPSQVKSIGYNAFGSCRELTSVSIPSSVKSIESTAFNYCSNLSSIYVYTVLPVDLSSSYSVFNQVNLVSCNLYVPFGTSGSYQVANQWSDFTNILEMPGIFLSDESIVVGAVGGTVYVSLASSASWTLSSDQEWLTVNPVSGTSGVFNISLTATNFSNTGNRTATVTAFATGLTSPSISVTQLGKTDVTAGNLKELLGSDLSTISHLTLYGTIDARDFKTMRDEMPQLEVIDLSQVTILAYIGTEGTYPYGSYSFPADGIPINAFYNPISGVFHSGLISATLPLALISIENNAFFNCSRLNTIYSYLISPISLSNNCNVFTNVSKTNCTLYVPFGTKPDYQAADQWKDFLNIVEMPGIIISANTLSMGANAANSSVTVATSVAWTATSDQEWLTVSPSSGIAGIKTLNIALTPNSEENLRTGTITISATGLESKIIKVTQYGRVEVTAGNLKTILSGKLETITNLTLSGIIDARDFRTMRDEMPQLAVIDLSQATIVDYTGTEGTYPADWGSNDYPANEIPCYAFYNPTTVESKAGLISIILPNSIISIGNNSFYFCSGLASVKIPSGTEIIGNYAFYNCVGLNSVNIPSSVKTIGNSAFSYCKGLTSISLPSSISSIGFNAFYYCSGLSALSSYSIIPVNLDSAPNVFYNINKTSCILYIPFGAKPAYQAASQWKDFLNIVEMPGLFLSTNTIDMGANPGTASIAITSSSFWTAVSDQAWLTASPATGASGAGTITFSATANLTTSARTAIVNVNATGLDTKTILVTQYSKVEVTPGNLKQILAGQLATLSNLTLTGTIDARDFKIMRDEMPLLTSLDLRDVSIVAYSGEDGTSPYNTDYPADAIPEQAFFNSNTYKGKPLKNIILPLSLTSVGNSAFTYCSQLTSVTIPEGVISIGANAFGNCHKLVSVIVPPSVNYIGSGAFSACSKLITVNISSLLNSIEYSLFKGCSSFASITIPSSVTSIGSTAFEGCIAITDINIPFSVISIDDNAFSNCSGLFTVDFDNPNFSGFDGVLYNKAQTVLIQCPISKTGDFSIPSYVKTIGANAFYNCKGLTTISIPPSVTSIKSGAFYYCTGLTTINIPASVKTIESYAFQNCNSVTSVNAFSVIPVNLGSSYGVFYGINKTTATLFVPFGTKDLYSSSGQWQDFSSITEMPGIFLSENSLDMGANSGTKDVAIASSTSWTVISDQAWLTLNPTSGDPGARTIAFSAAANLTTSARMAIVTVSATGLDPKTILVTQYGIIEVTAGNLKTKLSGQLETITNLTLIGTIDARDFRTMRDEMPQLAAINLSKATIVGYSGTEGTYPTDWGSFDYPANEIPVCAFYNPNTGISKISLESIILPEITKVIGDQAFYNCEHLSSIDLTSSITAIKSQAFYNCKELSKISIPASVNSIGDVAFYNSENIASIIAFGITPVDLSKVYNVFYGIDNTTCILFVPFGTKPDYQAADQWKDFLNIVEMPGLFLSVNTLNLGANAGSTKVSLASSASWTAYSDQNWLNVSPSSGSSGNKTLNISVTANMAGNSRTGTITFSAVGQESKTIFVTQYGRVEVTAGNLKTLLAGQLEAVTNLTLSGTIDARDFRTMRDEMPQLTAIDLSMATIVGYTGTEGAYPTDWGSYDYPANEIPVYAFYNPGTGISKLSLESIILPEFTTAIGDQAFNSCMQLSSIEINTNLTSIRSMAFYNCTRLTSLDFNAELTSIGSWAFYNCTGISVLSIPESVNELGDGVFYYSGNIMSIYVSDIVPIDLSNTYEVFGGIDKTMCVLYVPSGALSLYQAASQWQDFLNIVEINPSVYQSISLSPGWNIMSINVMPEETNLKNILNPLITGGKLKKVMDETGAVFEDWGEINGGWQNTIGEMKTTEGYKINVTSDIELEITGFPLLLPFDIQLTEGWNIISWPSTGEQDGMDVFHDLIVAGKLKKVMDEGGYIIEDWGVSNGSWQNFIGNLKPGEGYKVNVTSDCILTINGSGAKSKVKIPELIASTHFKPVYTGNGTDHMNINLVSLAESCMMEGDELGIFDGELCVGSALITRDFIISNKIGIPVSANDGLDGKNGFTVGNDIVIRLFRNGKESEIHIIPVYGESTLFEKGSTLFAKAGISTGIAKQDAIFDVKCYPVPFSNELFIEFTQPLSTQTKIRINDILGRKIKEFDQDLINGHNLIIWDGNDQNGAKVVSGYYFINVQNENYNRIIKVTKTEIKI